VMVFQSRRDSFGSRSTILGTDGYRTFGRPQIRT
jgi:hypothetical protein